MLQHYKVEMYDVIGCVETTSGAIRGRKVDGLYVLGLVNELEDVLKEYSVDVVLMVGSSLPYSKFLSLGGRFGPLRRPEFKIVPEILDGALGASLTMIDILPGECSAVREYMNMKIKSLGTVAVVVLIVLSSLALSAPNEENYNEWDFWDAERLILDWIRRAHVDSIGNTELFQGAIDGIIKKLDPHSSFLLPDKAQDFKEKLQGNFEGIGITFAIINKKITVIEAIKGDPRILPVSSPAIKS